MIKWPLQFNVIFYISSVTASTWRFSVRSFLPFSEGFQIVKLYLVKENSCISLPNRTSCIHIKFRNMEKSFVASGESVMDYETFCKQVFCYLLMIQSLKTFVANAVMFTVMVLITTRLRMTEGKYSVHFTSHSTDDRGSLQFTFLRNITNFWLNWETNNFSLRLCHAILGILIIYSADSTGKHTKLILATQNVY